MDPIYFDNAATSLQRPESVERAVTYALSHFGGVGRGVHEASIAAGMCVYQTREKLSALFGAPSASTISFSLNATMALNIAIEGLLNTGEHAITSAASHNSVLRPLYRKQERGCGLSITQILPDGSLDYEHFEQLFTPKTRLAVMTHASNLTGEVYDIARIARICHNHNCVLVIDAAQTAGSIPIDMQADRLDVVVFTGHKGLFGPQGTGGLCVSPCITIPPLMTGGSGTHSFDKQHPQNMPEALEAGTLNSHGIAGLLAGLEYLEDKGIEALHAKTLDLTDQFLAGLRLLKSVHVYGNHESPQRCGIVSLNVGNLDSALVSDYLSTEYNIMTRSGAHCAPLMHEALGTTDRGAVRFSFSPFNTSNEIDQALEALEALAELENQVDLNQDKRC